MCVSRRSQPKAGRITTVTAEEFMDLIDQMRLAVFEEAMLFELPAGSIDDPGGLNVIHGPWATEHCSTVLMCWLNLGWVALYRPRIPAEWAVPPGERESRADPRPHAMLDERDARALLSDPSMWTMERADGFVCLTPTERAPRDDPNVWFRDIPWLSSDRSQTHEPFVG
jgi:hypothetical protein